MIKLELPPEPPELKQNKKSLTIQYKTHGEPVWQKKYIKETLLQATNNRCAYSEARLQVDGNYSVVEHFKPKSIYPDSVVEWGNLLPSCSLCNTKKGNHDVEAEPIVHPFKDDPHDYLCVEAFRYCGKNEIGERTIKVLDLNNPSQFVIRRFEEAVIVGRQLTDQYKLLLSEEDNLYSRAIKRICRILEDCIQNSYSAVIATYIRYRCGAYKRLECKLREKQLWNQDLQQLKTKLEKIALPK